MPEPEQKWTARAVSVVARNYLEQRGVPAPRLDSELLLAHVLGCTRLKLFMDFDRSLAGEELARYREAVKQRGLRVPLQYITGEAEFMSLSFKVTPAVMVPRPETEFVVDEAIKCLRESHSLKTPAMNDGSEAASPVVVDIGTGCGNIAIAIARGVPGARVFATDISPEALSIARENAARHGVDGRITFVQGDLFSPLRDIGLEHAVALVVSNPPYVDAAEEQTLQPEVLKEPRAAVFAGNDALVYYRRIGGEAVEMLTPSGNIVFELGIGQVEAVRRLLESTGAYEDFRTQKDLAGIERVLAARRVP